MSTPDFILEQLEAMPEQCRLCEKFLNFIESELIGPYKAGKLDNRMVEEDMFHVTADCGSLVLWLADKTENPDADPNMCRFGVIQYKRRLMTED